MIGRVHYWRAAHRIRSIKRQRPIAPSTNRQQDCTKPPIVNQIAEIDIPTQSRIRDILNQRMTQLVIDLTLLLVTQFYMPLWKTIFNLAVR